MKKLLDTERTVKEARSPYASYTSLLAMLDQGWQIEAPVHVRQGWRSHANGKEESTYHFILGQGNKVSLVSVLDCLEMEDFLAERELPVDRL
jgi:hypothetical protein